MPLGGSAGPSSQPSKVVPAPRMTTTRPVMPEPRWIDVPGPNGDLKALTWGRPEAPMALCLHGFPDTAYGWRKLAPILVDSGWRVVAPFMRGYAPSAIPADGSYHVGALMDDALRVRSAAGATEGDVLIGHDWGAIAAAGLAAMPDSPFSRAVIMSVPPAAAFSPAGPGARPRPSGPRTAPPALTELVHPLLPAALVARAVGVVGAPAAVATMVAHLLRRGGSAPRRRCHRDGGGVARGRWVPTGQPFATPGRRPATRN